MSRRAHKVLHLPTFQLSRQASSQQGPRSLHAPCQSEQRSCLRRMSGPAEKIIVNIVDADGSSLSAKALTFKPEPSKTCEAIEARIAEVHGPGHMLDKDGDTMMPNERVQAGNYTYRMTVAPSTEQKVVSQTLESDRVFLDVLIDGPGQCQLPAALLFDTGCSLDLIISHYKAKQLGIQPDDPPVSRVIHLAGGGSTMATRYQPVKFTVVMNNDNILVPDRSAWLEVYCMEGTQAAPLAGAPTPLPPGMVRTLQSAEETQATGGTSTPAATQPTSNPVFKLHLSPVKRGRDSQGYDAILGKPGMHKLHIGMDKEGRLFALALDDQIISTT